MLAGTLCALGAGLLWGLVFVAPLWLPDYPAALLSAGRYLAFGLIALPLAWLDRRALAHFTRADWLHAPMSIYEVHLGSWRRTQDAQWGQRYLSYRELAEAGPRLMAWLAGVKRDKAAMVPFLVAHGGLAVTEVMIQPVSSCAATGEGRSAQSARRASSRVAPSFSPSLSGR